MGSKRAQLGGDPIPIVGLTLLLLLVMIVGWVL